MTYDIRVARQAERYFARLPRELRARILNRLEQIAEDPFGAHTKPLTNAQGRRTARVGDYRIVFNVDEAERLVVVSVIAPRGRSYRDL